MTTNAITAEKINAIAEHCKGNPQIASIALVSEHNQSDGVKTLTYWVKLPSNGSNQKYSQRAEVFVGGIMDLYGDSVRAREITSLTDRVEGQIGDLPVSHVTRSINDRFDERRGRVNVIISLEDADFSVVQRVRGRPNWMTDRI